LIVEAGEDLEKLMILCRADVTSKNYEKVKKYLSNFKKVEKKIKEVEEKDNLRNFQPVITGEDIMKIFNLRPSKLVGELKTEVREAILEGNIKNEYQEAFPFLLKIAKEKYGIEAIGNS
jgi:tRNA nucleotidyltransferase (CCA-adding enzyme)